MDIHENARLTPRGREHIVRPLQSGQTPKAAQTTGVCPRTVLKWIDRYRRGGPAGTEKPFLPAIPGNEVYDWHLGDEAAAKDAFSKVANVVSLELTNNRCRTRWSRVP